ncbi:DEAD/DEAH box helicase [Heyndrickxia sp. NPDC080065]|uniref:DEAD/DEAH box helicase n=1 Tax=Heyndrickxia sp. NPDC080065 TaxID=3390568 RepID=UPI003D071D29
MTSKWPFLSGLKPHFQEAWSKAGFEDPTAIQKETASLILEGKDVVASSPTGTGKTLAYVLPLLEKINEGNKNIQAVIIAPSRELVMQILQEIQTWAVGSSIQAASFIGGANVKRQLEKLKKRPQIIVGTPGRIFELIKQKKVKMHEVKSIVLDEGDQLITPEYMQTISGIIKSTLSERQLILFSATLQDHTIQTAQKLMKNPETIQVKTSENSGKVEHIYFVCEEREKIDILSKLDRVNSMKALVFLNDIGKLNVLTEKMKFKGHSVGELHSELKKEARAKAINRLQTGEHSLLLTTEVAARGLDIANLPFVIHFDLPENVSQYTHRSGRTGRLGSTSGTVISIVTQREERKLKQFCREIEVPVTQKYLFAGEIVDSRE